MTQQIQPKKALVGIAVVCSALTLCPAAENGGSPPGA
jgi:hypothetical protein